ncbi:hypothetical protein CF15_01810 [Pyrodictium occultum]|uniref:Uncharacterized protein n=1 Tax=Pyrodictium occultum TaxID=2309 RepID=A0A0V8RU47_PYROC|nr:hypothetical protein [Pyrodictium occultum]KSW11593.1 hypothetical protein CF15_01810 [Pyrodictium occultum]
MVYRRAVEEAYSIVRAVEVACGSTAEMEEALEILEELVSGAAGLDEAAYAAELLREAADVLRARGCLDWHLLGQAADILEHA